MKISTKQLRSIILKEIHEIKNPSLSSILFEGDDEKYSLGDEEQTAAAVSKAAQSGPAEVRDLVDNTDDPELLKKVLQGDYDEKKDDDVVEIDGASSVSVGSLIPTQKEIDMMQSVGWPLSDIGTLEKMISSKTSTAPGSISVSGGEVIDGHHRWSGIWAISEKEGNVSAQEIDLPGSNTSEKLAGAQLAIAAYKDPNLPQPSKSDPFTTNIMGKSAEEIAKMIKDNKGKQTDEDAPGAVLNDQFLKDVAESETAAEWAGFSVGDSEEVIIDAIAKKVGANLSTLPANKSAPDRADMPQFDHESMGNKKKVKSDIYAGLQSGKFNVDEPIQPESVQSKADQIISERWQKLAGLIK
tara:strand:+ start:2320 stop:3384 length:1065 start_codon:yes stop_codon:yes gene_type:complete